MTDQHRKTLEKYAAGILPLNKAILAALAALADRLAIAARLAEAEAENHRLQMEARERHREAMALRATIDELADEAERTKGGHDG